MTPQDLAALQTKLEAYFDAIARQREAQPPSLIPHFQELAAWEQAHVAAAPPRLRHYLQQKSYQKALAYLRGEEVAGEH